MSQTVYRQNGRVVTREEWMRGARGIESGAAAGVTPTGNWPQVCWALGVNPNQKAEAEAKLASLGCPTEYSEGGDPIFRSRGHRREFLRVTGNQDNDGGYGD